MEVTHEALFKAWPDLDQWLTEEQAFLVDLERIRGAHEVWSQASAEQQPLALLRGLLLTRARDWMLRYPQRFAGRDLEPLRAFTVASAAAEDAEKERAVAQQARTRRVERMQPVELLQEFAASPKPAITAGISSQPGSGQAGAAGERAATSR